MEYDVSLLAEAEWLITWEKQRMDVIDGIGTQA